MFLNPWYSGQPTAGSQTAAPVNGDINSQNLSSPEEVSHSNFPSDTGQDFVVEQVCLHILSCFIVVLLESLE